MADLKMQGCTIREIAAVVGYSEAAVGQILRQPFIQAYMINALKTTVQEELRAVIDAEVLPSLRTLVEVRDNTDAPAQARINAANSLLDRKLGKPNQPVSVQQQLSPEQMKRMSDKELLERLANGGGLQSVPPADVPR